MIFLKKKSVKKTDIAKAATPAVLHTNSKTDLKVAIGDLVFTHKYYQAQKQQ